MKSKQDLKKVFENGDKPKQEDFWEWQDSYWHKEEDIIPANKVDLSGKADLVNGKVPTEQLPSYVDDVLEFSNLNAFPTTGEVGKIYVAIDTGFSYRWSGSLYTMIHSPELDTLESVVTRGNYSPKYITFTGTTAVPIRDGALGMNTNTYSMYFGNMNPNHTGIYNLSLGYGTLPLLTEGTENSIFGHYAFNKLTGLASESRWNIGIGNNVAQNLPKASSNVFIGNFTAKNLSSNISESDLATTSPAAVAYMKSVPDQSGYNSTNATFNTSLNTFVGQSINETNTTPTRAAMSTIIGASGLYNMKFRNFNNIVIGAGNYMTVANATMYNSIVIGNSINLPNQVDALAIGMNRNSRINASDAIIYGLLPNTQLTFNAPITVPSVYMRNAQGDSTYTKQLVAKPNGDIGWEDKKNVEINASKGANFPSLPDSGDLFFNTSDNKHYGFDGTNWNALY